MGREQNCAADNGLLHLRGKKYIRLSRNKNKSKKKRTMAHLFIFPADKCKFNINSLSFYKWEVHTLESLYIPLVPILQSTQQVNDLIVGFQKLQIHR